MMLMILISIGLYYHYRTISPIAIGDSIGAYYHDPHPQISFYPTQTEQYQPMYLIKLKGHFSANHFQSNTIALSTLANGTYIWSLTSRHGNRVIYNFPGVPTYWGYSIFTPLSQSVNWGGNKWF